MVRKKAWPFYRTISGVRLRWEIDEPEGLKGTHPVILCCHLKMIRKEAALFCGFFLRKGEVFVYVERIQHIGPRARNVQTTGYGGVGLSLHNLKFGNNLRNSDRPSEIGWCSAQNLHLSSLKVYFVKSH